ncbi:hypothetical protein BDN70DRAFT_27911 [Pholiota conissans]|uniref:Uncharacterized protein n=1 Tax=Pholiota conissans TaxID=109636 RepID=A0A9P5ZB37_9AGAR|nr:hypothetical protein BDN70DRAFT_27911 [Pholiota conissans]
MSGHLQNLSVAFGSSPLVQSFLISNLQVHRSMTQKIVFYSWISDIDHSIPSSTKGGTVPTTHVSTLGRGVQWCFQPQAFVQDIERNLSKNDKQKYKGRRMIIAGFESLAVEHRTSSKRLRLLTRSPLCQWRSMTPMTPTSMIQYMNCLP